MDSRQLRPEIADSILDLVGQTPVLRLARLFPGDPAVFVKLELLNPGGSHKVRIAMNMIEDAERRGHLTPGSGQTILEPTGGNTGIGLAMAAAVLGYRTVLVIPSNFSAAKQALLRGLGADLVLSDPGLGLNSHGERAMELQFENPDWVMLNQQANPANPETHQAGTATEILRAFDGRPPPVMVCGIGTGGHLTGITRALRERGLATHVVAAVPEGTSILQAKFSPHRLQGLAIGFVPSILDRDLIDSEITVSHPEAVAMMRRCLRREGLGIGLSSAANLVAVEKLRESLGPESSVLTFAYDSAADYTDQLTQSETNDRKET